MLETLETNTREHRVQCVMIRAVGEVEPEETRQLSPAGLDLGQPGGTKERPFSAS